MATLGARKDNEQRTYTLDKDSEVAQRVVVSPAAGGSISFAPSGAGVLTTLDVTAKAKLAVYITGAGNTNEVMIRGRITGAPAYKDLWRIMGNIEDAAIHIDEYDELQIEVLTYDPDPTLLVYFSTFSTLNTDQINQTLTETVGGISYTGEAKEANADETHAVWRLKREWTSAGVTIEQYADGRNFTKAWSERNTAFPPAPLINDLSVEFDGVDEYLDCGTDSSLDLDGSTPFSFSCWFKRNTAGNAAVMGKIDAALKGYGVLQAELTTAVYLINTLSPVDYIIKVFSHAALGSTDWYHCVMTYDGTKTTAGTKVYLNGAELSSTFEVDSLAGSISTPLEPFTWGAWTGISSYYPGKLDECTFWSTALTQADVTELYNEGKPSDPELHSEQLDNSTLVSYWKMGDGATFPTIPDEVGVNTGTMTNQEATDIQDDVP